MSALTATFKKELLGYFQTPIAYVFIAIFLLMMGAFTFTIGNFYEAGRADLSAFFMWHPWLYLFLMPAITMRLWSEEQKSGCFELLLSMPAPLWQFVAGKFFAAWAFAAITLICSFPIWLTVNYLGNPDNQVIMGGYAASFMMAAGYIAIGSCMSAITQNQVIAFVLGAAVCLIFTIFGFPMVIGVLQHILPQNIVEALSLFSFITNFEDAIQGIIEFRAMIYFTTLSVLFLFITSIILEYKMKNSV